MHDRHSIPTLPLATSLTACSAPEPTVAEPDRLAVSFHVDGSNGNGICGGSGDHQGQNGVDATCNGSATTVYLSAVGGQNSDGANTVDAAIENWNDLLLEAKPFNVPVLDQVTSGGIPVYFPSTTSSGEFCGITTEGIGAATKITISRYVAGGRYPSSRRSTLAEVLTHEIAHVFGLNQQHGGSAARNSSLTGTGSCTSYLPTGQGYGGIPTSVCHHEIETIIRARNGSGYVYDENFYTSPLAVTTNVTPRVTSVQSGSTRSFAVSSWFLSPSGSLAKSATSLGWSSTAQTKVSVVSPGLVEGKQAGVGQGPITIHLSGLASALPSGYDFWTPFKSRGDSVTVTVTPPAPDILLDEVPVKTPGWHQLTYVGPGAPMPTTFSIDDSRTTANPDAWNYTSSGSMSYYVDAGSYTLTVMAHGIQREFPVCTESGEGLQGTGKKSGGGSTDAVEGCGPAGGGGEQ